MSFDEPASVRSCHHHQLFPWSSDICITTNIGDTNIWRFAINLQLARFYFGKMHTVIYKLVLHCCTQSCIRVVINLSLQRDDCTILLVLKCLPCGYNQSLHALFQCLKVLEAMCRCLDVGALTIMKGLD